MISVNPKHLVCLQTGLIDGKSMLCKRFSQKVSHSYFRLFPMSIISMIVLTTSEYQYISDGTGGFFGFGFFGFFLI